MELRHLRYFIAVAEELNFTRAARRLHISQPPLSKQIMDLEREVGARLLKRGGRRVAMTDAGVAFLEHARAALSQVGQGVEIARRVETGQTGQLSVGFMGSMSYTYLPWILRAFSSRYPGVDLSLSERTIAEQMHALQDGQLQVGLIRPPIESGSLASWIVLAEPFVVALPIDHILASRKTITLRALADELFIMFPRRIGGRFYDQVLTLCQQARFSPRVAQEVTQLHAAIGLVSARLGVALVPASMQLLQMDGVVFRPLREKGPRAEIAIAWRRDNLSPAVQAFAEMARETVSGGWRRILEARAGESAAGKTS